MSMFAPPLPSHTHTHILAGYSAGTCAVALIIEHAIVQEGVYFVFPGSSLFSPICYAVYPNMKRAAFRARHVADATGAQGRLSLAV